MRRWPAALALLVVLALPMLAVRAWFDPAELKLRAAAAVRRATGRELTIAGPLTLAWSPLPRLRAEDVHLANPPGLSRPDMAIARSMEAGIALLPLLTGQVRLTSVTVLEPDIRLELAADGRPNWRFDRSTLEPPASGAPASGPPASGTPAAAVTPPRIRRAVEFDGIRINQGRLALVLPGRTVEAVIPDLTVQGLGANTALDGEVRFAELPFQLRSHGLTLHVTGAGVDVTVTGAPDGPTLSGTLADLSVLSPIAGLALPPVRDIRLAGQGGQFEAKGQWGGAPVTITVQTTSDPPRATLAVSGATLTFSSTGGVIDAKADVPDLAASGAASGLALPPLTHLTAEARLQAVSGSDTALRGLRVLADQGNLSGDVVLGWHGRPSLRGSLVSRRLDAAALTPRPLPVPVPVPVRVPVSVAVLNRPPPGAPTPIPMPILTPVPGQPAAGHVFSDRALPFPFLTKADADLQVSVDELALDRIVLRAVQGHIRLQTGHLQVEKLQVQTEGGAAAGRFEADADPARAALTLRAPGVNAGALAASWGASGALTGIADVDLVLEGQGSTPHALVSTVTGHAGLALVQGDVDNAWLAGLLSEALRGVPVDWRGADLRGRSAVRCLGIRANLSGGKAVLQALTLDATRLQLTGAGDAQLANETLDLVLNATLTLGGTSIAAPVHLDGPWRAPRARMEPGQGRVGLLIGGSAPVDTCPSALLAARDGHPGLVPDAPAVLKPAKPADLLRSLFR